MVYWSMFGAWLSLARAPGSGPGGRWFESTRPDQNSFQQLPAFFRSAFHSECKSYCGRGESQPLCCSHVRLRRCHLVRGVTACGNRGSRRGPPGPILSDPGLTVYAARVWTNPENESARPVRRNSFCVEDFKRVNATSYSWRPRNDAIACHVSGHLSSTHSLQNHRLTHQIN